MWAILKNVAMKKLLFIYLTALAFSCDAPNKSSERGAGSELEETAPADPAEDNTSIHSDTTTSGGTNRQNQYDTLK